MPTELDEISRKIMQLEIEKQALSKETDAASQARMEHLDKELSQLKEESCVHAGAVGKRKESHHRGQRDQAAD